MLADALGLSRTFISFGKITHGVLPGECRDISPGLILLGKT